MSLFSSLSVSASGMSAQRTRAEVITENLANAETTRTPDGGPYRRKDVVFESTGSGSSVRLRFSGDAMVPGGVSVSEHNMSTNGTRSSGISLDIRMRIPMDTSPTHASIRPRKW